MGTWYQKARFYHIYPLGLLGAPRQNDGGEVQHRFPELTNEWLPHIDEMGFNAIYIGPLFESGAHGYDTTDYRMVDRRLGDNDDFRAFVGKAHELGMHVIVDGVFNHTGRGFFAFQDIKKNRESSKYINWYKGIWFGGDSAYHDGFSYESWRGSGDLVNLNLQNPEVVQYLLDTVDFWISEFDIDGIRLDCADVLDFGFMRTLRAHCDSKKADFWLMGEVIHGEYHRWMDEAHLYSVTDYDLWKGLYSGHNSNNYFEIAHTIRHLFDPQWGSARGCTLYTFADNHDVSRIASMVNDKRYLYAIYLCVFMLPGVPSVYYGSEFGIEGKKEDGDWALRPALDLKKLQEENPDELLTAWIQYLNAIRMAHPACAYGEYKELVLTNRQYAFSRSTADDTVIAAMNNDDKDIWINIPVPLGPQRYYDAVEKTTITPKNGKIAVKLPAFGARIFTRAEE